MEDPVLFQKKSEKKLNTKKRMAEPDPKQTPNITLDEQGKPNLVLGGQKPSYNVPNRPKKGKGKPVFDVPNNPVRQKKTLPLVKKGNEVGLKAVIAENTIMEKPEIEEGSVGLGIADQDDFKDEFMNLRKNTLQKNSFSMVDLGSNNQLNQSINNFFELRNTSSDKLSIGVAKLGSMEGGKAQKKKRKKKKKKKKRGEEERQRLVQSMILEDEEIKTKQQRIEEMRKLLEKKKEEMLNKKTNIESRDSELKGRKHVVKHKLWDINKEITELKHRHKKVKKIRAIEAKKSKNEKKAIKVIRMRKKKLIETKKRIKEETEVVKNKLFGLNSELEGVINGTLHADLGKEEKREVIEGLKKEINLETMKIYDLENEIMEFEISWRDLIRYKKKMIKE